MSLSRHCGPTSAIGLHASKAAPRSSSPTEARPSPGSSACLLPHSSTNSKRRGRSRELSPWRGQRRPAERGPVLSTPLQISSAGNATEVAIVYFDASALVKLVIDEAGSDLTASLWDGCDAAVSSRLAYPEVCAALAAANRHRDLSDRDHDQALDDFGTFWAAVRPVELTARVETDAGRLAREQSLRGADAVHLASALAVPDPQLVVAVWDQQLSRAAAAMGLAVSPAM